MSAKGAGRGAPPRARAAVGERALVVALGNAAARAALDAGPAARAPGPYDDPEEVRNEAAAAFRAKARPARDALRLAARPLRDAYDAHVTRAEVEVTAAGFRAGVALGRFRWPLLREVRVTSQRANKRLACVPQLAAAAWPRLETFLLSTDVPSAGELRALGAAGWADGLEELDLSGLDEYEEGVEENAKLDAVGVRALARGRWAHLRRLRLRRTALDDAGLVALLAAPWVAGLEELDLQTNNLTAAGARRLLGIQWQRLRRVDLRRQGGEPASDHDDYFEAYLEGGYDKEGDKFANVKLELEERFPGLEVLRPAGLEDFPELGP